jgi:hypothetical protein
MASQVKKDKLVRVGENLFLYIFLAAVAMLSCYLFFLKGLPWQDDIAFHLTQCYDVYYGFKNGFFGLSTNHLAMGAFGYNVYLFYGPLPHYLVGFLYFVTENMGGTLIGCYKFTVIASVFISGIFTYLLGLRVSKGNRGIALVGALLYMLFPYRYFCIFCRGAFSEGFAMAFIPMLFYSLYRILNDKEFYVSPFINTILAVVFLVLSHPFTALLNVTFALLYLLVNIKKLIKVLKRKGSLAYTLVSLILVVGLVYFYAIPTFIAKSTGSYIVCDADTVWTTYDSIVLSIKASSHYSGFFDLTWISGSLTNPIFNGTFSVSYLLISMGVGLAGILLSLVTDYFIQKLPYSKYYRFLVDLLVLFILPAFLYRRVEVLIGLGIYYVFFVLLMLYKDAPSPEDDMDSPRHSILRDPDFYYILVSAGIVITFIFCGVVWKGVPSIYYQAQFAWREWSLFSFFCSELVIYLLSYFQYVPFKGKKYVYALMGCVAVLFMSFNHAYVEKRAVYEESDSYYYSLIGEDYVRNVTHEGVANEYLPIVFSDSSYTSKYSNSLYTPVKNALSRQTNFIHSLDMYNSTTYCPRALEGDSDLKATKLNTPAVTLEGTINQDDTLVQIPQFYYDGYEAKVTDMTSNSVSYASISEVDGLVAFKVSKVGTYTIDISYKGSKNYRIGKYLFIVSSVGLVALGVSGYLFRKKQEKNLVANN